MASEPPKVRFVKCPKCMQILPEFANIPIYKCGGCALVLRAKYLVAGGNVGAKEPLQKSGRENNYQDNKSFIPCEEAASICSTDSIDGGCIELKQKNETEKYLDNSSDTSSKSGKIPYSVDTEVSEPDYRRTVKPKDYVPGDNNGAAESQLKDGTGDNSADNESINFREKEMTPCSSNVYVLDHDPSRNNEPQESLHKNEAVYKLEDYDTTASRKPPLTSISSVVDASHLDFPRIIECGSSNQILFEDEECSRKVSSSDEISSCEKKALAQVGESGREPGKDDGESNTGCTSETREDGKIGVNEFHQNFLAEEENYLHDSDQNQQHALEPAQIRHGDKMEDTESVISEDMLDAKLSGALENLSKSPTTTSTRAYYSSLSSNEDDYDSYFPPRGRNTHLSRRTLIRPTRTIGPMDMEGSPPSPEPRKSKIPANSTVETQLRKTASISSYERYGSALSRYSDWIQDEQFGSRTTHGFEAYGPGSHLGTEVVGSAQSHMETERGGASRFPEKVPHYYRDLPSVYQNGNLSKHVPREFDNDQMELIRKVERLRDHLSGLSIQRGKLQGQFSGGTSDVEPLPPYRKLHRPPPPHSYGAYKSRMNWQSRSSQLRFSGATNFRHHLECSCSHCRFEDWQYSSQLSCDTCYSKGLHHAYPSPMSDHLYSPTTFSPQQNVHPGFPLKHHNNPSAFLDSRLLDHDIERLYNKGKHWPVKRHCLPIAGGAPFIMCYNCWKLLQLPADFLMASKRYHKLQCGACSEVLMFSLLGKIHVVPYSPAHDKRPLREDDNDSGTDATAKNVLTISRGDVVSYSDEYGLSIAKSYSTEGEHPMVTAQCSVPDSGIVDKTCASSTSAQPMEKGEISSSEEIALRSDITPEMVSTSAAIDKVKKLSRRTGSPLHRLMGYSSPSDVMNYRSDVSNPQSHVTSQIVSREYLAGKTLMMNGPQSMAHVGLKSGTSHVEKDKNDEISMGSRNMRDSSLAGRVKKGLKNINHSLESMKQTVHVNGRLIPETLIKKAEVKAGPIRPGDYWYDYRAGFWGVMGKPCLGIIPPLIEEFGSPMAKDCAGGNTSILVNGRELHEDDFELLLSIGLPDVRNKTYSIDATGCIIDEASGKELGRLDKLAPTIERAGHGFGMLDPSLNASS